MHQIDVIAVAADGQRRFDWLAQPVADVEPSDAAVLWRLVSAAEPLTRGTASDLAAHTGPAWIDHPRDHLALFYNPFAALWQEFRERQVADFLDSLTSVALQSGFDRERIFSHQLLPELNGSWNSAALATARVFHPGAAFLPGITLYGGIANSPHLQTCHTRTGLRGPLSCTRSNRSRTRFPPRSSHFIAGTARASSRRTSWISCQLRFARHLDANQAMTTVPRESAQGLGHLLPRDRRRCPRLR